jgi:hypothetical protein
MAFGFPKNPLRALGLFLSGSQFGAQTLLTKGALPAVVPSVPPRERDVNALVVDQGVFDRRGTVPWPPITAVDSMVVQAVPSRGGVTAAGLNPAVSPQIQRATFERIFQRGREIADAGQTPVVVVDHRLTALDDRPIIRAGFEALVRRNNITELRDLDAAMGTGVLKFLPGYTEEASDHWRQAHASLVAQYPAAFGAKGERIPIEFMNYPLRQANATANLAEFVNRWRAETGGRGEVIFAGAGSGALEELRQVYMKPVAEGGAGLNNPDVRFGAPELSSEGEARAVAAIARFNAAHPGATPVEHDRDSRGKAGWIEAIEREGKVVAAFIDDRAHNRLAVQAVGSQGDRMVVVKAVAPGLSFSQVDNDNANQISTFGPNP